MTSDSLELRLVRLTLNTSSNRNKPHHWYHLYLKPNKPAQNGMKQIDINLKGHLKKCPFMESSFFPITPKPRKTASLPVNSFLNSSKQVELKACIKHDPLDIPWISPSDVPQICNKR